MQRIMIVRVLLLGKETSGVIHRRHLRLMGSLLTNSDCQLLTFGHEGCAATNRGVMLGEAPVLNDKGFPWHSPLGGITNVECPRTRFMRPCHLLGCAYYSLVLCLLDFFGELGGATLDSHHGFVVEHGKERDVDSVFTPFLMHFFLHLYLKRKLLLLSIVAALVILATIKLILRRA
ncbi:uncharacterized protein LOC129306171 isoform X3 [Prosopis cineraria]|uniref:uncharacterized protein LOC129306171 isoform X3 n=1 Tax=Prosopis cineraria TaxID=364024 RepID=UPI00240F5BF3|nr:uncharacterized protein LOC129306171 isoform X3 [Prosopis cineraria]